MQTINRVCAAVGITATLFGASALGAQDGKPALRTQVLVVAADANYDISKKTKIEHPSKEALACLNEMVNHARSVLNQTMGFANPSLGGDITLVLEVTSHGKASPARSAVISPRQMTLAGTFIADNPPGTRCDYPGKEVNTTAATDAVATLGQTINSAMAVITDQAAAYASTSRAGSAAREVGDFQVVPVPAANTGN